MKRIAIPVSNNRLCAHFGHSERFYLYDIKDGIIVKETQLVPPPHEPGLLPKWLHRHLVTDVIAGGLGQRAISQLNLHKINVFVGAPLKPPAELIDDHMHGCLRLSENYCDH